MKTKKIMKKKMKIKSNYYFLYNFFEINIYDNDKKYLLKVLD